MRSTTRLLLLLALLGTACWPLRRSAPDPEETRRYLDAQAAAFWGGEHLELDLDAEAWKEIEPALGPATYEVRYAPRHPAVGAPRERVKIARAMRPEGELV